MPPRPLFLNPHLAGDPFFWPGGDTGVLLIHGFTATTAEVRPLAQFLHARGFTVAGPLLPGHGTQPQDLNRVRWEDWVQAAEDSCRELRQHCSTVFVGGESTGGILALYLGSEHEEIAGLLCYAPALRLTLPLPAVLAVRLMSPWVPWVHKKNAAGDSLWQGYTVNPLKGVLQLLRLQGQVRRRLPAVRQPLLIVQGKLDPTVHASTPETIAGSVSSEDVEIHWMEASAHCVVIDRERDRVAEISLDFINRQLEKRTAGRVSRTQQPA